MNTYIASDALCMILIRLGLMKKKGGRQMKLRWRFILLRGNRRFEVIKKNVDQKTSTKIYSTRGFTK